MESSSRMKFLISNARDRERKRERERENFERASIILGTNLKLANCYGTCIKLLASN